MRSRQDMLEGFPGVLGGLFVHRDAHHAHTYFQHITKWRIIGKKQNYRRDTQKETRTIGLNLLLYARTLEYERTIRNREQRQRDLVPLSSITQNKNEKGERR